MISQPLFVIGAPRSGTTFLCQMLNQHADIQLTNESRIFVLLKDLIEMRSRRPEFLDAALHARFAGFMTEAAGELVERFYREGLGVSAAIWGDKHPPYADPSVLSARRRFDAGAVQSGSCLRLIRACLPQAKFLHIHRDPIEVARSLARKRWTQSLDEGILVWRQYLAEIAEFFAETEDDRRLAVSYHDLIERPGATSAEIGRFLGLADWSAFETFLTAQLLDPTPFSDPETDLLARFRPAAPPTVDRLSRSAVSPD